MPQFYLKPSGTDDPASGISSEPESREPKSAAGRVPFRTALRNTRKSIFATVKGIPRIFALVWRVSPPLTLVLAIATVLSGLVPAATAWIIRLLIDAVTNAARVRSEQLPDVGIVGPVAGIAVHTTATGAVLYVIAAQFLVFVVQAIAGAARNVATELLQELVSQDIQARVMDHAGRLELAFFEDARSYDLVRQAREEAAHRPVAMISNVYGTLQNSVTFVSVVALLVALNPWVALAVLLAPVPAFVADARFGKTGFLVATWASPIRRRMQYLSTLVTTDSYAKEVKLFGLSGYLVGRFRVLGGLFYRRQRSQVVARSFAATSLGALSTLVGSLTYLYVALQTISGRLTLGDLVMYTAATVAVQIAVQTLFSELTGIYENTLYLDTLHEMLATRPSITRPEEPTALPDPLRGHIVFENVTFTYPGASEPALRDVSLAIEPGTTLAVVGSNGAGKSTLIKLVCRLYDPQGGRILLDGVDLREFDPEELRAQISAAFQDYRTYQATAAENIGLGDPGRMSDRALIEDAAAKGGADGLIRQLSRGYDTPLGKWFGQGTELSGGQWQKIALSRAFVRDARILVFDEPTSAIDPASEHELFSRLRVLAHRRTSIYVSHRFSTVRQADRIVLLSGGRVIEEGTHTALMAQDGEYAQLFLLQASAYLDEPATTKG
ncbi:MAG: ATP-binding cassette, subfamily bacterial [Actinomycetota bacterium]|jgi:ATP-binding cassette subfamily B protein|nr:ATP-binding cassette, subfamily bacterial [Actinomycetota bacterium]